MQKILHLTLKKKWFDLIASGKKKQEFREFKEYWVTRLFTPEKIDEHHTEYHSREYDEIHFKNGYGPNVPFMRVEYINSFFCPFEYAEGEHGEDIRCDQIVINLGDVLEVRADAAEINFK